MKKCVIPFCNEIPNNWVSIPNKYLFVSHSKKVGTESNQYQLLSLTTTGVKKKDINASGGKVPDNYENYQTVNSGDMIFCLFDLDCSAVFSGLSKDDGMITSAYDVFKTRDGLFYNRFADYWFQYVFSNRYYKMYSKNIRYTVTGEMFGSIHSPVPPFDNQVHIANFLTNKCSEIDELIEVEKKQIEKLKEYKQSIIMETVTKGLNKSVSLRNSGVDWIGDIPEHWSILRIKNVLLERSERSVYGTETPLSMSQKFGLIPTKDLGTIPNMASSLVGAKITHVNDLVFNKLKAHLGVFSVSKYNGIVSPDYAVYYSTGLASLKYLEYLFKTPQCIMEFKKKSTGIAAGLTRLYTSDLFGIYCPYPSLREQQIIVDYLDKQCSDIDGLIELKNKKMERLTDYKKSLIYECVTGKQEVDA